jgi:N-acyl homoserine lactone hydrolase
MTDMKLFVLDLGSMKMDKSLIIAKTNLASVDAPTRPAEFVEFPVSAYLIETASQKLLFDTGCNPEAMGTCGRWPQSFQKSYPYFGNEDCQLPNRLRQLGMGPDDIDVVILSHMHNDHAGCVEFFKQSKLFVHIDELSAAMRSYALHLEPTPYVWKDIDHWSRQRLDWYLVDRDEGDIPLLSGVTILNLGSGHSYGMLGLHVVLNSGGIILASDALYCAQNYGDSLNPPGVLIDSLGWERTAKRIKWLEHSTHSKVWFGHDAAQFSSLKKSSEAYYT